MRVHFVGTYKNHGKFQPSSLAKSVATRTVVSGAVQGYRGSGCRRDCWLAVSDWLVAERPGNRIAGGRGCEFVRTGAGAHTASCTNRYGVSFLYVKRPVRCVDHPLPSVPVVKEGDFIRHGLLQGELHLTGLLLVRAKDSYAPSRRGLFSSIVQSNL